MDSVHTTKLDLVDKVVISAFLALFRQQAKMALRMALLLVVRAVQPERQAKKMVVTVGTVRTDCVVVEVIEHPSDFYLLDKMARTVKTVREAEEVAGHLITMEFYIPLVTAAEEEEEEVKPD